LGLGFLVVDIIIGIGFTIFLMTSSTDPMR